MLLSRIADRGSEELVLYPEKTITNIDGATMQVPDMDNPVTLQVNASTGRQSDSELIGQVSVKVLTIITRDAPVGSWVMVKFRGEMWDVAAPPTISGFTPATRHYEFQIRSRNKVAT